MIKNFSFVRKTSLQRWRYFAQSDLCNVSNKIIFKVLRHRLKQVLFDRISETQSVFVLGQITDNIVISQKMLHALGTNLGGRNKKIAIKTDIVKNMIKWNEILLELLCRRWGFRQPGLTG